jgi:hypothetical protein
MSDDPFTGNTFGPQQYQTANSLATSQIDLKTTKQARVIFYGGLMIGPFQYLVGGWLKFQVLIPFRGREQRLRIYQTFLESHFNEYPCSF